MAGCFPHKKLVEAIAQNRFQNRYRILNYAEHTEPYSRKENSRLLGIAYAAILTENCIPENNCPVLLLVGESVNLEIETVHQHITTYKSSF